MRINMGGIPIESHGRRPVVPACSISDRRWWARACCRWRGSIDRFAWPSPRSAITPCKYEDPRGNVRLRRQIAKLVFRQGATCEPDDIVITSGSTEALNLSIRAVAKPGDVVAVETPGCFEILTALKALHMRAIEVPHVGGSGIDLERARRRGHQASRQGGAAHA